MKTIISIMLLVSSIYMAVVVYRTYFRNQKKPLDVRTLKKGDEVLFFHENKTMAGRVIFNYKSVKTIYVVTLSKPKRNIRLDYSQILEKR